MVSKSITTVPDDSITSKGVPSNSTTSKGVPGNSITSKTEAIDKASTPNKPYTALGCKQHYSKLKKATTPDLEIVNNGESPPRKPLGNRIIAINHINIIAKLIREALLTGFTTVDINWFII